jgi:probable lipoprotein NlpC
MTSRDTYPTMTLSLLVVLLAATLQACATADSSSRLWPDTRGIDLRAYERNEGNVPVRETRGRACCTMAVGTHSQEALARTATRLLGRSRIEVGGQRFTFDCSGLARGVYFSQGVDLYDGLGELDGGNGVGRIYGHIVRHGRIHYGPTVHPGDLVFFHNTWDFNRDDHFNDPLTHVGVVEQIESDGTVVFVSRVAGGIERFRMNLRIPDTHRTSDGRVLNDFMRKKGFRDPEATRYLTGQLFAAFGTLLR